MITNDDTLEILRYPVGRFEAPAANESPETFISEIAAFPARLRAETATLSEAQLATPYRPEGWTVKQVIHHSADSHMNAYIRFKLALTEDQPVIKPYFEDRWAELPDYANTPITVSLDMLDALHTRWLVLLRALTPEDFKRAYIHPEFGKVYSLFDATALYAWHSRHHLAHITELKRRNNW